MPAPEDKYQSSDPRRAETIEPGIIISPDTCREKRLPPGQTRTRKWPILHYGHVPTISLDRWRLQVFGLVENALTFTWPEFQALPRVKVYGDFHCVTRWSRLDNVWEGVAVHEIMSRAGVKAEAKFVVAHGYDSGFTTNLPLADFLADDALFADRHDGEPLTSNHGGPCRLIVPRLYAWKSAKWLRAIELVAHDRLGYWEQGGYHNHGDPWTEERFNE
jgi:DMSO/TMAO reductase YedYZ molybdopterin-dependent catalytic subunit